MLCLGGRGKEEGEMLGGGGRRYVGRKGGGRTCAGDDHIQVMFFLGGVVFSHRVSVVNAMECR